MIPFSTFLTNVQLQAAPEGLAENLQATFRNAVTNGLIDMQTVVPCLRDFHIDFFTQRDAQNFCDVAIINGPRGVISQIYAFKPGIDCRKYYYQRKSSNFIQCWTERQRCVTCTPTTTTTMVYDYPYCNYMIPGQDACDVYGMGAEDDRWFTCTCLTSCCDHQKYFSVGPEYQLFLAPRFPCGYVIACQWEGIKRVWADQDAVPDDEDLKMSVAKYVEAEMSAKDREWNDVAGLKASYVDLQREMAKRCRDERKLTPPDNCATPIIDNLLPFINPLPYAEVAASFAQDRPMTDQDDHILVGRTLRVDQVYGNDTTARRGEWNFPYLTITAAKAAALSGDEIVVGPGTYYENNLQKAGVNYHFEIGVVVHWDEPGYMATSTSTVSLVAVGQKTLQVAAGLPFSAGDPVSINLPPNTNDPSFGGNDYLTYYGSGTVVSYSGTTLVVNLTFVSGGFVWSNWLIFRNGYGIFDDRAPGAVGTYNISGSGEFIYRQSNPANSLSKGPIVSTSASNNFTIELNKVSIGGPAVFSNRDFACASVGNCTDKSRIKINFMESTGELWSNLDADSPQLQPGSGMGVFWREGELYVDFDQITTDSDYCVWAEEPSVGKVDNLFVRGHMMESTNFSTLYCNTVSAGYRVWCDCLEILSSATNGIAVSLIGPARIYINAQKIQANSAVANSSELWLICEKITASQQWVNHSSYVTALGSGSTNAHITCQHYEDIGITGIGITNSANAILFLHGGYIKAGASLSTGVFHQAGKTKLMNVAIDMSSHNLNTVTAASTSSAGLELWGCKLFMGAASTNSLASTVPLTVQFVGQSLTNKVANGNTTQLPLASLVVDATIVA